MVSTILLDSHAWLWMNGAPERLGAEAREHLADAETMLYLSAASIWEIAIKAENGKLELPGRSTESYVLERIISNRVEVLPIRPLHALRAAALPPHHRDPFDRMLVAQAILEGCPLMTADSKIRLYDVETISAST